MLIDDIVDFDRYALGSADFDARCQRRLDEQGVLVLEGFIRPAALSAMQAEGEAGQDQAYFCSQSHSVYLTPRDPAYRPDHPMNRQVVSSKGCICDDVVALARDNARWPVVPISAIDWVRPGTSAFLEAA